MPPTWFAWAVGAGASFAALATLYRGAVAYGLGASCIGSMRLLLGACVAVPVLHLLDRSPQAWDPAEARLARVLAVGVPILTALALAYVAATRTVRWDRMGWLALLAFVGVLVVACNVCAIAEAAREGVNASFPLAVAATCYLVLTYVLNAALFKHKDSDGAAHSRWARPLSLAMAVAAIVLMSV